MRWELHSSPHIELSAEPNGVLIRHLERPRSSGASRLDRILPAVMLQLADMDIGQQTNAGWLIPYIQFANIEDIGIDAFDGACKWSPLTLELESTRWIGAQDFRYRYRFYMGTHPRSVERM